ncbi:hypothetical protein ACIP6V_03160 [Streptomyces sp. NPDC088770]|uniref:hypothetical protein n=1 Tax=Streptomyces sp. NPDC088770 TaxID=3365895 RepID=UPI0037F20116
MPYEGDDRGGVRRDLRLRTLWHRCWGAIAVLLGVALIFFAGAGLTVVPDDTAEEHAYRAARPCGAAVTEDCLRLVRATVRGTEIRERARSRRYDLRLTGPGPVPREVAMGGAEPLLRHLRAGDVVTVTMWRGYATAVSKDDVTQYSDDNPEGLSLWATAIALALLAIGLFAAYAGGHAVARASIHAATGLPTRLRKRGVQTIGAVCCAVPAGMFGLWTGPVGVIVRWPALVGVLLVATRRLDAPKWGRGRHARAVTHPE